MKNLKKEEIFLRKLTIGEAEVFNDIHSRPALSGKIDHDNYIKEDNALEFTKRMLWLCQFIYTIRLKTSKKEVVGSCVLYNWDKENKSIYFGGSLIPAYWGYGFMSAAFSQLMEMAKYYLGARIVKINVKKENEQARKMVEKLGFSIEEQLEESLLFSRPIDFEPSEGKLTTNNMDTELSKVG